MKPYVSAVRAIASVFVRRTLKFFGIAALVIIGILIALTAYASSSLNSWWLLLLVPLLVVATIGAIIFVILWLISGFLAPRKLSRGEQRQLQQFSDRLAVAAGAAQVSRFTLAALLIKDAMQGRSLDDRLKNILNEGKGLRSDLRHIHSMFIDKPRKID